MSASTYLHILGRQPALGLAELEAVYSSANVQPAGNQAALTVPKNEFDFPYLGGSMKIGKLLATIDGTNWHAVIRHIEKSLPHYLAELPEGKVKFGVSVYDFDVTPRRLGAHALDFKKIIKAEGHPARIIPNQEIALSSAQVLHNQLAAHNSPSGFELLVVRGNNETYIARTLVSQDIDSYTLRDRGRPKRDSFVGMLPPKLAQIMINLAAGRAKTQPPLRILDPFCGTGVVLQEALLMGHAVYGTDLEPRMVEYSKENLEWLKTTFGLHSFDATLEVGDAMNHTWKQPADQPITAVAAETYLGTPLQHLPSVDKLNEIVMKCDKLHRTFLKNLAVQLPSGTPLLLAVPAWRLNPSNSNGSNTTNAHPQKARFRHLPVIDELARLGYNQTDFTHVTANDLLYYREDQLVARELLVLTRR